MKHIGNEIRRIALEKNIQFKDIAEKLGISRPGFFGILSKESIDCKRLEEICKIIGANPASFFNDFESKTTSVDNTPTYEKEIELLKELLADKERTIKILMESKGFKAEQ